MLQISSTEHPAKGFFYWTDVQMNPASWSLLCWSHGMQNKTKVYLDSTVENETRGHEVGLSRGRNHSWSWKKEAGFIWNSHNQYVPSLEKTLSLDNLHFFATVPEASEWENMRSLAKSEKSGRETNYSRLVQVAAHPDWAGPEPELLLHPLHKLTDRKIRLVCNKI